MTAPKIDLKTDPKQWNVGLIGYGEVGRILAEDLRKQDVRVAAYDIKLRSDQAGGACATMRRNTASRWRHRMPISPRNPTSSFPPLPRARRCRWRKACAAGDQAGRLVSRLQFGFARRQAARGRRDRRRPAAAMSRAR